MRRAGPRLAARISQAAFFCGICIPRQDPRRRRTGQAGGRANRLASLLVNCQKVARRRQMVLFPVLFREVERKAITAPGTPPVRAPPNPLLVSAKGHIFDGIHPNCFAVAAAARKRQISPLLAQCPRPPRRPTDRPRPSPSSSYIYPAF